VASERADDAMHDVTYLRRGRGRGEQEPKQQAQDYLPGAQAHIPSGQPYDRAEHYDERNRNRHLVTSFRLIRVGIYGSLVALAA
jgi:hypothetical protein